MEFHEGLARRLLDEFPLNVVVLDDDGEIVRVDRAWRDGRERGLGSDSVGVNYLDVAAAGLSEVLGGSHGVHARVSVSRYAGPRVVLDAGDGRRVRRPALLPGHPRGHHRPDGLGASDPPRREEAATTNRMFTHELRNAVVSTVGWLDLLDVDPDQAARVERIASALERIERTVSDSSRLLALAHERQPFERLHVEDPAGTAWDRSDRGGVSLEFADRFPVICYLRQTEALFESLFDNATAGRRSRPCGYVWEPGSSTPRTTAPSRSRRTPSGR